MYKVAEDESVICPYNRYHVISKLKIQKHLIKCKRNHPEVKLATCFYNYTHRLRPEDMLEHYEVCPYKARVEGARYESTSNCGILQESSSQEYLSGPGSLKSYSIKKEHEGLDSNTSLTDVVYKFKNFKSMKPKIIKKEIEKDQMSETWENSDNDTIKNYEDDDEDDSLEPLPLPKTVSKAFTCSLQRQTSNSQHQVVKGFGRGKNFLCCNSLSIHRSSCHLLPDVTDTQSNLSKAMSSKLFMSSAFTSCSELSDPYDECTTLKSDNFSVIFDEDGYILKDLDYYVNI